MAPHAEEPYTNGHTGINGHAATNGHAPTNGVDGINGTNGTSHPNGSSNSSSGRMGGQLFANGFRGAAQQQRSGPDTRPNILYIMADQMSAPQLSIHNKNSKIKTPNIEKLASEGVVFDSAYCNSPLCAPSRFCMISGQLPSKIGGYDNASTLSSEVPTYAHYLRREGYQTILAGKMHFIGPDQLHGFESRLTTDIYPADFGWSVNWEEPELRQEWYHNMSSVHQAGPCARSNQLDFDEEVMYKSTQWLYDYARQPESRRPFCLTVSMTHPHDPYTITKDLWDLYEDTDIPLPNVSIADEDQDQHSARILKAVEAWGANLPDEAVKRARRAYYGSCSYIDQNIGKLRKVLKDCELDDNTIIIFGGDHGDMLGERNLWYKMSWFEGSSRIPFIFHYPKEIAPRRVKESVSSMDLLPTLVDLVGGKLDNSLNLDGRSLYPALYGEKPADEVFGEYMGEGTISPLMMIRRGRYKYVTCLADPPQLFDLEADPKELQNLATSSNPTHRKVFLAFESEARAKWSLSTIHDDVVMRQRQRRLCWSGLSQGFFTAWDYSPRGDDGTTKYIRSTIPLDDLERKARFPVVDANGKVKSKTASWVGAAGAANQ